MTLQNQNDPYYRLHLFVCTNERPAGHERGCCKERGAVPLRNYMKAKAKALGIKDIRVNIAGCLDRCELGPVMVIYPQGVWYHFKSEADIDRILVSHVIGGEIVADLALTNDQTELADHQLTGQIT
jgi:(2Fe-2S) ferredoxin